jgi:hypothetical protein
MCASPLSPRHAQPDWMGGGLVSRQMLHTLPVAAISVSGESPRRWTGQAEKEVRTGHGQESPMAAKDGLAARCLNHRGMDSSFAGLGGFEGGHGARQARFDV